MNTYCRPFFLIDYSCADFIHNNSVLCRLFTDLVHTLSKVNVFYSNAAARQAGSVGPFFVGEGAEVAVHWPPPQQAPTPLWAMLRQRGAPQPPPRLSRTKRSGQSSIGYRCRRLRGLQDEGRGVTTHGRAEASGHEGGGAEARNWG